MVAILEERRFPVGELRLFASARSVGDSIEFQGDDIAVEDLAKLDPAEHFDLALFSAGSDLSLEHAPQFATAGAWVVDNSSAFREAEDCPLVVPEIMIPLVAIDTELSICREQAIAVAEQVLSEQGQTIDFKVGTMIEVPRAALTAHKVAEHADFFSFGTNDLTQLTYGFSRDDMGKFLPGYLKARVLEDSPLSVFDEEGVGELVKIAAEAGKARNAQLKVGVCGEHGGDPRGVRFFHAQAVDYVSCSPFRVPVARLAAAQAALAVDEA